MSMIVFCFTVKFYVAAKPVAEREVMEYISIQLRPNNDDFSCSFGNFI